MIRGTVNPPRLADLFVAGEFRAVELGAKDAPALQHFFAINPEYFFAVTGQPPTSTEAYEEIQGGPPPGWPFNRKWTIGFVDKADSLVGMANIVSDLLAPGVWHIGLLIIATQLHGRGAAQSIYEQLEGWARDGGAQWLRLGVVEGNRRAERFWQRCSFVEVRKRNDIEMGKLLNTIRVMVKPLQGGTLADYLLLVARDSPEP